MNFRRIEYILITAFLIIDIFLVYVFVGKNALLFTTQEAHTNLHIDQEMKKNEIQWNISESDDEKQFPLLSAHKVTPTLSQDIGSLQTITTENMKNKISVKLNAPLTLTNLPQNTQDTIAIGDEQRKRLDQFVETTVYNGTDYQFSYYDGSNRVIVYTEKSGENGANFMDSDAELLFHIEGNKVVSFEQSYVDNVKTQGSDRRLISSKQAIENVFLANEIPNRSQIEDVTLGYQSSLVIGEELVVFKPVWRVSFFDANGSLKIVYVDAIAGTVIQNTTSTSVTSDS